MTHKPEAMNHPPHPIIRTRHICKKCMGRIWWAFVPVEAHWQIIKGENVFVPYDWYLDVHCFCGDVTDKEIIEDCYMQHKRMISDEIHRQQNEAFSASLGPALAEHIHKLNGGSF
jgi:hypothetical protein